VGASGFLGRRSIRKGEGSGLVPEGTSRSADSACSRFGGGVELVGKNLQALSLIGFTGGTRKGKKLQNPKEEASGGK